MTHPFDTLVQNRGSALTLADVQSVFPQASTNASFTGRIPISIFEKHEGLFRDLIAQHRLRAIYRGPRKSNRGWTGSMTCRADAEAVLLYRCTDKGWRDRVRAQTAGQ